MKKHGKYTSNKGLNMKPLAILLALTLLVGCAVGGTLAWLTAQTPEVTNTFTVGDIEIKLQESPNLTFKVVPGATDKKDPWISVKEGSEKCYVYALVVNNLVLNNEVVGTPNISTTDWEFVAATTDGNTTLYRYKDAFLATADDNDGTDDYYEVAKVFTTVSYDGAKITKANIGDLAGQTIVVDAFAHQSENTTVDVADAAAKTHFGLT